MNLENGFSFTQQKGDVWMPATPEKPVLHRSNQVLVEMQQSEKRQENWEELLGIYSGFLQYRNHSELPPECSRNSLVDLNQSNPTTGSFSPAQMYDTVPQQVLLPWDHPVGLNHRGHSILDGNPVDKQRSSNHNAGNVISNLQSRGDTVPHMKVDSIAELMGMKSTLNTPTMNGDRITCVVDKPSSIGPYSQVERNWKTYRTDDMMHLQKQILNGNHDGKGYNLPQIPTSRLSVTYRPSYNLNLQPMMEAGESSSVSGPLHQESVTPDQQKLQKKNEILQVPLMSIDDISTKENNKQDNAIHPQLAENGQMEHNNSVLDSKGKNDGEIDLNKTPAQKTPKRRKHRPKVVVEGKPKRTPKPKATEKNTPEGNSTKRKYVRKKGVKTSTDQPTDDINRVEVSNVEFQAKTCKRSLNFDLENVGKKIKRRESDPQADNIEGSTSNLNVDIQNAELNRQSTMNDLHQNTYEKQKMTENPYRSVTSVDEIPPQETLPFTATSSPLALTNRALNAIARSLSMRNANINQSGSERMNVHAYHHIDGGLAQVLASTSKQNLDGIRQPRLQNKPQLQKEFADASGKHESQREFFHNELKQRLMVSQIWPEMGHYNRESESFGQNGLESSWIKKVENKMFGCSSSQTSGNRIAKDCSEKIKSTWNKNFHGESSKVHQNNGLSYLRRERKSTFIDLTDETNMVTYEWSMNSTNSGHRLQKQGHSFTDQIAHTSHHFAKAHTTVANSNIIFASQRDCQVTRGRKIADPANVSVKRQAARQAPPSTVSRNLQGVGRGSKKVAGSHDHKKNIFSIDDIIDHMKRLYIGTNNGKGIVGEEQNALVPYRPDGAVVPFEAFDPIQKRRSRPKVDLDPETNRLWNLLMGKEGSESAETLNENKQKFWEDERKVFRGRVDSFIARMHLVQGDRRFSKWKGSVVDSVIGVFLTQNVSDHLSSSAFMSLAARFPPKSTTTKGSQSTEHEVIISYPDERTSCHQRLTKEPVFDHGSVISSQPSKYKEEHVTSEKTVSINNCIRRKEEGMISSQSSSDSVIFQTSEDIRSSSGSNSEAEDQITGSSFRKKHGPLNVYEQAEGKQFQDQETGSPFPVNRTSNDDRQPKNLQHSQNPGVGRGGNACCNSITNSELHDQGPLPQSTNFWQKMLAGMDENETDLLEFSGKECTSSLTSTHFDSTCRINMEHAHVKAGGNKESNLTDHQTRSFKFVNNEFLNKHPEQQMNSPTDATESQSRNNQHIFNCSQGGTGTCQQEGSFLTDPVKAAWPFRQMPSGNQNPSENITLQPTEMKTMHTSDEPPSKISSASNVRKRKAEKEKVEPFNWDTLRKQVQSEAGTQRSRRTLDSLDYEALQNASVHEISQTIKERGMNNLLAERMKDFLNRLVKDHGSIDLEWLRDVQPDKSKDYLLSIRGLGLKSVECVRLLTLHHLAFPVDTNVGRIAVRLGWVPLQPLPETLQLHLLELYPVLETIQKYLWPRLCMLDQETLYELHYQLITFGKVFCTKRQPNCNACPMRGECRHFASAFASARLALPGPEERRVVCSNVPSCSSKCCGVVVQPMLLPPAEDNVGSGPAITGNCEPIIEEPSTPESSIEVTERDIEDAFYDDPDEIPEIKLNIEEFTTNLQSFMQEKMEMQEGDMSKALVALSPGFASIPTPKLKHVSRLRTEHQVYELPDSHPLLKGMDRREPDDPSPYLLAMWAPGETADSVQPTENECCPAKGGVCNLQTCFSCNSMREAQSQTVRGTILIPCRTAMRGSFPLNGTYFQVNEVFADDETSVNPIDVPRSLIWNLPRRTVFFGTSVSTIFKGLSTEDIQYCFWKGFVCVRGFNQKTRAPRPLKARLHLTASMMAKKK